MTHFDKMPAHDFCDCIMHSRSKNIIRWIICIGSVCSDTLFSGKVTGEQMSISNTSNIVGAVMACVIGTIFIVVFVILLRFVRVLENHRNKYMCTCTAVALHWTLFINTFRPRQNGRHFTDNKFKHIFSNKNVCISIEISLKFVPKGPINSMPALVQIMAWRQSGDKPLSELMMISLPTHICVTRP